MCEHLEPKPMNNTANTTRRRFTIELEHTGNGDDIQGLRRWLKTAWRSYSLRCISIATHPPLLPTLGSSEPSATSDLPERTDAAGGKETGKAERGRGPP